GTVSTSQEGFGIMLRDDVYLPISDYNSSNGKSILSNYVASGIYNSGSASNVIYSRENASLKTSSSSNKLSSYYTCGGVATITMERSGGAQNTTCTVTYGGTTYTYTYYDFDYAANDYQYSYLCFYATRGTMIEISNVTLQLGEIGNA
ncbi:MAG: hypothetical protein LUD47_04715, partial [Clostridia bacterium]|nr:hypothetical protein [Clostridia bacterium]